MNSELIQVISDLRWLTGIAVEHIGTALKPHVYDSVETAIAALEQQHPCGECKCEAEPCEHCKGKTLDDGKVWIIWEDKDADIKYCPMCGRKLAECDAEARLLTVEELLQMNGQLVWVIPLNEECLPCNPITPKTKPEWYAVSVNSDESKLVNVRHEYYWIEDMGEAFAFIAYDREPKEAQQ